LTKLEAKAAEQQFLIMADLMLALPFSDSMIGSI